MWDEITTRITSLKLTWIFESKEVREALNLFTRELTAPKAKALGWNIKPDEDHIRRQFISVVSSLDSLTLLDSLWNGWSRW